MQPGNAATPRERVFRVVGWVLERFVERNEAIAPRDDALVADWVDTLRKYGAN